MVLPGRASSTANCSSRKDTSDTDGDRSGENHGRDAPGGHDITEEGLHRDIYRDGKKTRPEGVSLPIPANEGFDAAEEDLLENVEGFIESFEEWHGVKGGSDL